MPTLSPPKSAAACSKPGDQLPPQRHFAYQRKIAASTASRVYTELLRRGLVIGEVGRGTFVSGQSRQPIAALPHEPRGVKIDLEINYPMLPTQAAMIAKSLAGLERTEALEIAQRQGSSGGTQAARNIAASFMSPPRLDAQLGAICLHRQRTSVHCRRAVRRWCRPAAAAASRR